MAFEETLRRAVHLAHREGFHKGLAFGVALCVLVAVGVTAAILA